MIQDAKKQEKFDQSKPQAMDWIKSQARKTFSKKNLYKKVPVLEWLPKYNVETGVADLIAGLTVGLTVIPQGIAYALVAELPEQYGLYSAFMGCFMYIFFGSCKDITVGPTAIMALLTAHYVTESGLDPEYAVLLTFLTGIIITALGLLKLGFVIDFISVPVTAGFCSAAAITIASSQLKSIFGLEISEHYHGKGDEGILGKWMEVILNIESIRVNDTILGIICVVILLCMRSLKNVQWFNHENDTDSQTILMKKILAKTIWVISTARNAIIVVICTILAYGCDPGFEFDNKDMKRNSTFIMTGAIKAGLPPFQLPPFGYDQNETLANSTIVEKYVSFGEMTGKLGIALIIIPLLAILENVAIAKAFAGGKPVDASQEMIALGICNLMGSFVSSMPTTGSFSRTAVNCASGVRTPMGGIITGGLVILALAVLMPLCAYIPKASLAAVIITAVIFSVEYEVLRPMWKSKKIDLIPAFATFLTCLFWALEYGIMVGVGIQVLLILYHAARPKVHVEHRILNGIPNSNYIYVTLDRALIFPSVSYVRNQINKAGVQDGESRLPLVLDCAHISSADFTAAEGFKAMISDFRSRNQPIVFFNTSASVVDTFLGVNIDEFVVVHSNEELLAHIRTLIAQNDEEENGGPNVDILINTGATADVDPSRQP